jgi:hypothetical protein
MTTQESLREAARLRLRVQMNNRLRLESIAAISKVFREFGEPIEDELLASVVFAVPAELMGEYNPMNATVGKSGHSAAIRAQQIGKPSGPPKGPTGKPSGPPKGPTGKPSGPPKGPTGKPSLPPKGKTSGSRKK